MFSVTTRVLQCGYPDELPLDSDTGTRLHGHFLTHITPELTQTGQWQTAQDLHRHPELTGLVDVITSVVREICDSLTLVYQRVELTACWANVSNRGYPHRHVPPQYGTIS